MMYVQNLLSYLGQKLDSLSRSNKRLILLSSDAIIFPMALLLALWLRLGIIRVEYFYSIIPVLVFVSVTGVFSCWVCGVYKSLIRAFESRSAKVLLAGVILTTTVMAFYVFYYSGIFMPRSAPLIFILTAFLLLTLSRLFAKFLHRQAYTTSNARKPALIYGTGNAGDKIASVLENSPEFSLIGFIDEDKAMRGNYMRGRLIYNPKEVDSVVNRYGDIKIILSSFNLTPEKKRSIFQSLSRPRVNIEVVPSMEDLVAGRQLPIISRNIQIEDLLGRNPVKPIDSIFTEKLKNSVVVVTGGGGSIGSELCRQIIEKLPEKLVVLERNELALYKAENSITELLSKLSEKPVVDYRLGDTSNQPYIRALLEEIKPNYVFHAAAYKHVPIVENNVLESVRNNVFSTDILAQECINAGVQRFTLISTDKAVRPTNVMGATKRVSELVIQSYAAQNPETVFSMVRFGNVLGSSGSVLPLFESQIANGGPVTVTDKEVTRYFMTIPEAVQLVVQSNFMAKGGEIFVLDMGDPVRIDDLARLTIKLSGYTVRDEENENGEIEIKYTGLRPGEKLYEELTLSENFEETQHPQISVANDPFIARKTIDKHLNDLNKAIEKRDQAKAVKLLEEMVEGFKRSKK